MSLNNLVKRLQDIMRNDAGINGDAQRIEQMVWILFLKVYDAKEEIWEFYDENYTSIIPEELRWRNWAVDHKDGKALTGDALLDFVNGKLNINRGVMFKSDMNGVEIIGTVISIGTSQLGGVHVYIKCSEI